ncbi:MAG: hypothetical protein ACYC9Y_05930 [Candidatus Methylomirabilia bacterium]
MVPEKDLERTNPVFSCKELRDIINEMLPHLRIARVDRNKGREAIEQREAYRQLGRKILRVRQYLVRQILPLLGHELIADPVVGRPPNQKDHRENRARQPK